MYQLFRPILLTNLRTRKLCVSPTMGRGGLHRIREHRKMGWRVTSKKNDGNIEFIFENGNIDSKNGVKTGSPWGGGAPC